jgi:hypothetical protein
MPTRNRTTTLRIILQTKPGELRSFFYACKSVLHH